MVKRMKTQAKLKDISLRLARFFFAPRTFLDSS